VIFTQRHLVDFLGNSSGKTKPSVRFEIEVCQSFSLILLFQIVL
jgi:hypothetical protein